MNAEAPSPADGGPVFPAPDTVSPQLTLRAALTGMALGAVLSLCNVYAGLKIGWGLNMSIAAALIAYGFWASVERAFRTRPFGILENNVNQTAASAGASISSAGLSAPIPALTMLTGQTLDWAQLAVWVLSVALVGVVVAIPLRRQMILVDRLPFPSGIACAETLREMYAHGAEALARVRMLATGAVVAAALKVVEWLAHLPKVGLPLSAPAAPGGALAAKGVSSVTATNLGFAIEPGLLMYGVGVIVGFRGGLSMLLGAFVAWGVLGPIVLELGYARPGKIEPGAVWFGPMVEWMLWPGVAMLVTSSLTSFAFSWRSIARAFSGIRGAGGAGETPADEVPKRQLLVAIVVVVAASALLQVAIFDIAPGLAVLGVLLSFLLAVVAARVTGETAITPIGAMGKVTQLSFGALDPGNATANLMAANVTAGAASQCGDLLHDLKTGALLGASPRLQSYAQALGVVGGSLLGTAAYLVLIPDPATQLLTPDWPAPAVAQWKAVAEVFMKGFDSLPGGTPLAIALGAGAGFALAVLEKVVPKGVAKLLPSPAGLGLAFCIPAHTSIMFFLGSLSARVAGRVAPKWSTRFALVLAAGFIAGDSLAGVGIACWRIVTGT